MSAVAGLVAQLSGYRRLLALRDFRLLWLAQLISTAGDRITQIALATLVFLITGSDFGIGLALTLTVLPQAVFALPAGVVSDRASRKTLLVATDLARATVVLVLAVGEALPLAVVFLLTVLHSSATVLFTPTRYAVLPDLVPEGELLAANTLDETTRSAVDPLAYLVGGALIAAVGVQLGFAIDAATFLASAALLAMMTSGKAAFWHAGPQAAASEGSGGQACEAEGGSPGGAHGTAGSDGTGASVSEEEARGGGEAGGGARLWRELTAGLAAAWRQPVLRALLLLLTFAAVVASAETPLIYMMAFTHWRRGAFGLGVLEAALAVGFVVGALTCEPLVRRVGRGPAILVGLVATGASMAATALLPFWPAVAANGLGGVVNMYFFVPSVTLFQQLSPREVRARVMSARSALLAIAIAVSYGVATVLTANVASQVVLGAAGVLLATVTVAAGAASPQLRTR